MKLRSEESQQADHDPAHGGSSNRRFVRPVQKPDRAIGNPIIRFLSLGSFVESDENITLEEGGCT